ncbi:MAG: hypothetical protein ACPGNV_05485 [Mangrovicoccus sp.]
MASGMVVVISAPRSGSNALENRLAQLPGFFPMGEMFNHHFMGQPGVTEVAGFSMAARNQAPVRFFDHLRTQRRGTGVLRYFADHEAQILPHLLADSSAKKIILRRNPLYRYISHCAARESQQWRVTRKKDRHLVQVRFDCAEFLRELALHRAFAQGVTQELDRLGQSYFALRYTDLARPARLKALTKWLGFAQAPDLPAAQIYRQNPQPLRRRVLNYEDMVAELAEMGLDHLAQPEGQTQKNRRMAGSGKSFLQQPKA